MRNPSLDAGRWRPSRLLEDAVDQWGDVCAIRDSDSEVTYAQLLDDVDAAASRLISIGARRDEPIIVPMGACVESLTTLLGVWRAGCCAVPVATNSPARVVDEILERTKSRIIMRPFALHRPERDEIAVVDAPPRRDPLLADAALIVFTSGSTGRPKAAVLGHAGMMQKLPSLQARLAFAAGDVSLQVLRSSFVFAQWVFLLTVATGGTTELAPRFDPRALAERLCTSRVDRVAVVPTMLRLLLTALREESDLARKVRSSHGLVNIISGGELLSVPLADSVRASLPGVAISIIYGLAETSSPEFVLPPSEYERWPTTVGRSLDCSTWRVIDDDVPVARGETGELVISSPGVLRGYLDDPVQTAAALIDGHFRTGDLVREVGDGYIEIVGRSKNVVVRGGNKISPLEIETTLERHPAVAAAFACGVRDAVKGERLVAVWMAESGRDVTASSLTTWLRAHLEPYKVPDAMYAVDELPLGATGKADRVSIERYIRQIAL